MAYLELRDSLAHYGPLNSICVRPSPRFPGKYDVADGLYRVTAGREIALPGFPVHHQGFDRRRLAGDPDSGQCRAAGNDADGIRPADQADHGFPSGDQAGTRQVGIIHKSPGWIRDTLGLVKLRKDFQLAVDRGEMPLGSAYELARIPYKHQAAVLRRRANDAGGRVSCDGPSLPEAVSGGRAARQVGRLLHGRFQALAYMRPLKEVLAGIREAGASALVLTAENCKTPLDAWRAALAWVMHLDRESIEAQRQAVMNRNRNQGGARQTTLVAVCSCFLSPLLRHYQCPTTRTWSP